MKNSPSKPCSTCRGIGFTWKHIGGWNLEIKDDPAFQYHPVQVPCSCQEKKECEKCGNEKCNDGESCSNCKQNNREPLRRLCHGHPTPPKERCGTCSSDGDFECPECCAKCSHLTPSRARCETCGLPKGDSCPGKHTFSTPSRAEGWEADFTSRFDHHGWMLKPEVIRAVIEYFKPRLLSSRRSAIEEAIEAVGLIERRSDICHPDDRCEHRAYNEGLSVALSRLRLLREESEDKKDGV